MDLFDEGNYENLLPFSFPEKDGYKAVWDEALQGFLLSIPNGELFYSEKFFDKEISDRFIEYILKNDSHDWRATDWRSLEKNELANVNFVNIRWNHDKINMYGKQVFLPRYSAWYGDGDKPYTYSGLTLQQIPWNKGLSFIKNKIETDTSTEFNSVLMNWYRDGGDYINWHSDEEPELGQNPVIGSVNFGATRRFILRRKSDNQEKLEIPLKHGTLLLMRGETQHFWQHSVPKERKIKEARFNLTFRFIKM